MLVSLSRARSLVCLQFKEVSRINPAHAPTRAFLKLLDEVSKSGVEVDALGTGGGGGASDGDDAPAVPATPPLPDGIGDIKL